MSVIRVSHLFTACCRCLDLGLQDPQTRDALLSEGLLPAALPLLRPDAGSGPMHALMRAVEALPDCLDGVDSQAGWASLAASYSAQQATHISDVHISKTHLLWCTDLKNGSVSHTHVQFDACFAFFICYAGSSCHNLHQLLRPCKGVKHGCKCKM